MFYNKPAKPKKAAGFTLIELMIVVAIIGILSAIAIPKFADLMRKTREGATKGNLGAIRSAINIYYGENEGWFPAGPDTYVSDSTYLQASLIPRYIDDWPTCHITPYHKSQTNVDSFPAKNSSYDSTCDGEWGYCGSRSGGDWGTVFVECWHTDSKGVTLSDW
ncbi:MAG: prepilin-type N-terminal cleavage/methylation domain-containing protein [Endomicrobiales bacterium]|nr:prepilin-type N-terminal cleavage/methylation domain-containing protein [Endomicrobiales bacterium]